ncbi:hypothetical protein [Indioceanicola profundi]|nr:hypothetical protein [Indioceanicola profundi]
MATDPSGKTSAKSPPAKKDERKERLAQALRENLRKRKEQGRAREEGEE